MKKASIITLQYIDNYGSVLQTYATQEIFRSIGYESEIVNYTRENCTYSFQRKLAFQRYRSRGGIISLYPIAKLLECRWSFIIKKRTKVFDSFRNKYINLSKEYSTAEELLNDPPIADVYVTGSDQTWNAEYNGGVLGEYFLNYAPHNAKKIALSASIGTESIAQEFAEAMAHYVNTYDGVSVREQSAVVALESIGYSKAVHVLDPTLMLSGDEWTHSLRLKETDKPYVFMYQLNDNIKMLDFAAQIARDNNIELIIITPKYRGAKCKHRVIKSCKPEHFLALLKNAKYVVTDSFHGTAFSFNFNKNVFVFNPPKYSTRIKSILDLLDSDFRLVKDEHWRDIEKIDFKKVNRVLSEERAKVRRFLSFHLNQ